LKIAELYLERWTIEGLFQTLTDTLDGERPSLGYPEAALFAFAIALVRYNLASVLRAALRATFGHDRVEREISWYYVANDLHFNYGGMDTALDEEIWVPTPFKVILLRAPQEKHGLASLANLVHR
ncbi:MAG: IS4/IS5 family transposase, partial [Verrucomicrobia bacterium]|nr:IS4/IS5 family transposase [Verrucomicrobiota bacterium]